MNLDTIFEYLDLMIFWVGGTFGLLVKHLRHVMSPVGQEALNNTRRESYKLKKLGDLSQIVLGSFVVTLVVNAFLRAKDISYEDPLVYFAFGFVSAPLIGIGLVDLIFKRGLDSADMRNIIISKLGGKSSSASSSPSVSDKEDPRKTFNRTRVENYLPRNMYDESYRVTDPVYNIEHCNLCRDSNRKYHDPLDCGRGVVVDRITNKGVSQ